MESNSADFGGGSDEDAEEDEGEGGGGAMDLLGLQASEEKSRSLAIEEQKKSLESELGVDLLAEEKEAKESRELGPALDPFVQYDKLQASSSLEVKTETKDTDSAFQCKISGQVNIKRNQSALVPFLQSEFKGEKVAIYNKAVRISNPLAVIKFPNTFGIPLEEGPLSIYEDDIYVGEAMIPQIKPSKTITEENNIYIAYSVELKCTVTQEDDSECRNAYRVQFHDKKKKELEFSTVPPWLKLLGNTVGNTRENHRHIIYYPPTGIPDPHYHEFWPPSVTFYAWRVFSQIYIIDNKKKQDLKLIIEHRRRLDCELIETPEPLSKTEHWFRFALEVKAESVVKFTVKERRPENSTFELNAATQTELNDWKEKNYVTSDVLLRLGQLVDANILRKNLAVEYEHVTGFHSDVKNELARVKDAEVVVGRLTEVLSRQAKDLHQRQEQEEDLEKKIKTRKQEMKDFQGKNPGMKAPAPTVSSPSTTPWKKKEEKKLTAEEEAYEEFKKMEQRFQQDESRYVQLKKQNEEDTKLLNELNTAQATQKTNIKEQVNQWDVALTNAKAKYDLTKAKVDSNKSHIEETIKAIISTGGDRFIGPESERPKKEGSTSEKEKQKIIDLFAV